MTAAIIVIIAIVTVVDIIAVIAAAVRYLTSGVENIIIKQNQEIIVVMGRLGYFLFQTEKGAGG